MGHDAVIVSDVVVRIRALPRVAGTLAFVSVLAPSADGYGAMTDVIVVGAGLAGLSAARHVAAAGRNVRVLEARNRVGGRTVGHTFANGFTVEMGGQWVGTTQTEMLGLISELGLQTFATYDIGDALTVLDGAVVRAPSDTLGLPDQAFAEVGRVDAAAAALVDSIQLAAPWRTNDADELDSQTFESWLRSVTRDEVALRFFRTLSRGVFAAESYEMSLLHFLFYVKSAGTLDILVGTTGGAQELRVAGGSHRVSERLADELGDEVLRLGCEVRALTQDGTGVTVHHTNGADRAEQVIVTLPPALAGRLRYDPPLPASRDGLTQQLPMGSVIKVQAAYDAPFWRDEGLSGQVVSLEDPFSVVFDDSPPDGSSGVLVGFFEASHARAAAELSHEKRRALAVDCLTRYFGPRAARVSEYVERDWAAEPFTRGCYGGRLGTGVWTQYGAALVPAVGRIHWAGAESSDLWNGYMDGAIRSGRRAADEALGGLT